MRLFSKTIRTYLLYSVVIILVTVPVFYVVMGRVLQHAVDKSLNTQLHEIRENLDQVYSPAELGIWARLDKDIRLSEISDSLPDRLYTIYRFNQRHHEAEPYREVEGAINVGGRIYKLVISISLIENEDLLGSILVVQAILLILLMGGMIWINHRSSKRLWQPFYIALRNMQQFELNKETHLSLKESTTDEFNELNKAIRNMFRRNYEIYLQQKEFTENASHEMQTPLAIFRSKIELLMQTSPLSEDQAQLINDLDTTNRRLVKLNKSLLLLTKIENNQYHEIEEVNVAALCEKSIRQIEGYAGGKGVVARIDRAEDLVIYANPVLIEILIGNLLSNAFKYNLPQGRIDVILKKDVLMVRNTGAAAPLHEERIFDRFNRQGGSTAREESTGLGLAIVKNICAIYQYTIGYSFEDDLHTFTIRFRD